jgi:hypothetical protein
VTIDSPTQTALGAADGLTGLVTACSSGTSLTLDEA